MQQIENRVKSVRPRTEKPPSVAEMVPRSAYAQGTRGVSNSLPTWRDPMFVRGHSLRVLLPQRNNPGAWPHSGHGGDPLHTRRSHPRTVVPCPTSRRPSSSKEALRSRGPTGRTASASEVPSGTRVSKLRPARPAASPLPAKPPRGRRTLPIKLGFRGGSVKAFCRLVCVPN